MARIEKDRDAYEAGTEAQRAYMRGAGGLRKVWDEEALGGDLDLATVMEDAVEADVETGEKRRRAATIVTDPDLPANPDAIGDSTAEELEDKENWHDIDEFDHLPPPPPLNTRPETPKTGSTPPYFSSPLAFRPSPEAVRPRPTSSQQRYAPRPIFQPPQRYAPIEISDDDDDLNAPTSTRVTHIGGIEVHTQDANREINT